MVKFSEDAVKKLVRMVAAVERETAPGARRSRHWAPTTDSVRTMKITNILSDGDYEAVEMFLELGDGDEVPDEFQELEDGLKSFAITELNGNDAVPEGTIVEVMPFGIPGAGSTTETIRWLFLCCSQLVEGAGNAVQFGSFGDTFGTPYSRDKLHAVSSANLQVGVGSFAVTFWIMFKGDEDCGGTVMAKGGAEWRILAEQGSGFVQLEFIVEDVQSVIIGGGSFPQSHEIGRNRWAFVHFQYDEPNAKMWGEIDRLGITEKIDVSSPSPINGNADFALGGASNQNFAGVAAAIDQLTLHGAVLTDDQLDELFGGDTPGIPPDGDDYSNDLVNNSGLRAAWDLERQNNPDFPLTDPINEFIWPNSIVGSADDFFINNDEPVDRRAAEIPPDESLAIGGNPGDDDPTIVFTISGWPGSMPVVQAWNSFDDPILNPPGPGVYEAHPGEYKLVEGGTTYERWNLCKSSYCFGFRLYARDSPYFMIQRIRISYITGIYTSSYTGDPAAGGRINDGLFRTKTFNGVTFTWARGVNW